MLSHAHHAACCTVTHACHMLLTILCFPTSCRDATGQPWASVLVGRPGFVSAPDSSNLILQSYRRLPEGTLQVAARPIP